MESPQLSDILPLLPQIILVLTAGALLVITGLLPGVRRVQNEIVLLGVVASAWARLSGPTPGECWAGTLRIGTVSVFVDLFILAALLIAVWVSGGILKRRDQEKPEFYALLLISSAGAMIVAAAADAIVLIVGLEVLFLPLVALAAFQDGSEIAIEAGVKTFFPGVFSSLFIIYGFTLLLGESGGTSFSTIGQSIQTGGGLGLWSILGLAGVIGGLCFKLAVFPFHASTIDISQGSPTPVGAFYAVVPKVAVLVVFFRIATQTDLLNVAQGWLATISIVAVGSQVIGNVVALVQHDLKRLLAYSGVAHIGYALVAFAAADSDGGTGLLVYIASYSLMMMGAFVVVDCFSVKREQSQLISDLEGQGWRQPIPSLALSVCLISLAGVPPLLGFFAKFLVFGAAIDAGLTWLVVVSVINSVVSATYYLRVVGILYMKPLPEKPIETTPSLTVTTAACACAVALVITGLYPSPIISAARIAAASLVK